jgi:hypothetical protein
MAKSGTAFRKVVRLSEKSYGFFTATAVSLLGMAVLLAGTAVSSLR